VRSTFAGAVGGDGGVGDCLPREEPPCALAARHAQPSAQRAVGEQSLERGAQGGRVARRHEQSGLAVDDEIQQAPDRAGDYGASVGHRLGAHDAEALTVRRTGNHRSACVQPEQLVVGKEAERARHLVSQRPVARNHEIHPDRGLDELPDAFLRGEPARIEHLRRVRGLGDIPGKVDAVRDHAHLARPEVGGLFGQRRGGRDHEPGPPEDRTRQRRQPSCDLDVGAPYLQDVRLTEAHRDTPDGQPMRMDQVGVRGRPTGRTAEAGEHQRREKRPPRLAAQVAENPRAVGDPVVPEVVRGHDLDLDLPPAQPFDGVGHEPSRGIALVPGVRRGEDEDLHPGRTTGSSSS